MPRKSSAAHDSDDEDSSRAGSAAPEEGAKGSSSSQVRKAQNRIAQREFRLRKQQYIRDLEAKVQVLEANKEERVGLMTLLVRNLLKENKDLRGMVRSMASFVGEGLGSCLPRLGLTADQLDAVVNRADTDTAYEAFLNLKATREMQDANPGIKLGELRRRSTAAGKRKRTAETETPSAAGDEDQMPVAGPSSASKDKGKAPQSEGAKRTKSGDSPFISDEYTYLFPDLDGMFMTSEFDLTSQSNMERPSANPPPGQPRADQGYPRQVADRPQTNGYGGPSTYPTDIDSGFGLTLPPSTLGAPDLGAATGQNPSSPYPSAPPMHQSQAHPPLVTDFASTCPPPPFHAPPRPHSQPPSLNRTPPLQMPDRETPAQAVARLVPSGRNDFGVPGMSQEELEGRKKAQDQIVKSIEESDAADRKLEAMQLITYHLNNFRMNHEYHLPPSLRPTVIQRTVPHEHAIDGICFPSMRDRMILLRGRYDLVEVFHALLSEFTLHGDDVLDHRSYEISEKFVRQFTILVDDVAVDISNKWRAIRGEPPIEWPLRNENGQVSEQPPSN
ncbi:hypothetical protein, variant 1 [Cryptococcus amylolentus CBS 6039]|uniref:BZIP domain-containing protein n=3 Tax=Cryptococcus amylolentus TaxID=104669 RepID=A0A1E3HK97_9TREE|nr:hypothetical protein, variant 1 [Cryptococcus amylolentus CBS 6039]ODN76777.1 hypothetical protein, variant 1 [Cryptococcus amylolentus CBS 6039]ODO04704.1 hypothetical protein I350_05313 [Cryptococcus amylolentus CBS 6273]